MFHFKQSHAALLLGLSLSASTVGAAPGGEALPDRPGFGDAIRFEAGSGTATAHQRPLLAVRPGFGEPIRFLAGDPREGLLPPPGRVAGRAARTPAEE
jgi:hypothetical protein